MEKNISNQLQVGDKFIGKLKNEYQDKIITITERMIDDDDTLMFIHYFGFKKI